MTLIRELQPSETWFFHEKNYQQFILKFSGELNISYLELAFSKILEKYPSLRGALHKEHDKIYFSDDETDAQQIFVYENTTEELPSSYPFDQRSLTTALLVYKYNDGTFRLILMAHHAVSDAAYVLTVLHDLTSFYTQIAEGKTPEVEKLPFPQAAEDVLRERNIEKLDYSGYEKAFAAYITDPSTHYHFDPIPTRVKTRISFTPEETNSLLKVAQEKNIGLNSLLNAATGVAVGRFRGLPQYIPLLYPVNLRPVLDPKITDTTSVTVLLGITGYELHITEDTDPVALAFDLKEDFKNQLKQGIIQQSPYHTPNNSEHSSESPVLPQHFVLTTNLGQIPSFISPKEWTLLDFNGNNALIGYPGHEVVGPFGSTLAFYIFDGELKINIQSNAPELEGFIKLLHEETLRFLEL